MAVTQHTASKDFVVFTPDSRDLRHWKLSVDGRIATLALDVDEDGGLRQGYKLKLNSYDLGVDIELHNVLQRIRFEHPEVACVILTSARERMFCAGANIYMLGSSSHAWKVNFCKFTNETRNGMEDSSQVDGLRFLAALNGTTAGGGYELALACDEIILIDDRSSAVSLPETPLLGVLPGTGGLTRVVDKRKVRRDLADLFCSNPDGVKGERAKSWGLVDEIASPANFQKVVQARAEKLVKTSARAAALRGVELRPLRRTLDDSGYHYTQVDVVFDRQARTATLTISGPRGGQPQSDDEIQAAGDSWWPVVECPRFTNRNPDCYGLTPGALFQVQPAPYRVNCDWTRASTGHSGGIQTGLADGSVRTVAQSISYTTWWFAMTPDGGETMPSDW